MAEEIDRLEEKQKAPKPKINVQALKERMCRLNVTYMADNKSDEEYFKKSSELKALIAKANEEVSQEEPRNLDTLKSLLATVFTAIYPQLDRDNKRALWRSLIKEI